MKLENAWYNFIIGNNIATEKDVNLITDINGAIQKVRFYLSYTLVLDIEVMSSYWMMAIHQIMN